MPLKGLRCLAPKTSRLKITIWYAFWNTDEINYILGSELMEPIHPEVPQQMRGECLNAYSGSNRKPRFPFAPGPRALTGPSSRAGLPQMTGQGPPGWQLLEIIVLEATLCKMYGGLLVGFQCPSGVKRATWIELQITADFYRLILSGFLPTIGKEF